MKLRFRTAPPRREDGTLTPAILLAVLVMMAGLQLALTDTLVLPEADAGRVGVSTSAPALSIMPVRASPVILARPLFAPGRGSAGGTAAQGEGALGGTTVAGTMSRGRQSRLFLREADGTIITLAPGGSYRGWQLTAITGEGARFLRAGKHMTINYGSQAPEAVAADDEPEEE